MIDEIYASQVRLEELVADDFRVSNQKSERWKNEIDKQTNSREVGLKSLVTLQAAETPVSKGWRWQESVSRARNGERLPLDPLLKRGFAVKVVHGVSVGNGRGSFKAKLALGQVVSVQGKVGSKCVAKVANHTDCSRVDIVRTDIARVGNTSTDRPSHMSPHRSTAELCSAVPARIPTSQAVKEAKSMCRNARVESPLEVCGDASLNDVARVVGDMDMVPAGKGGVLENCNTENKSVSSDVSMPRAETAIFGLVMHSVDTKPSVPEAGAANHGLAHGEATDGQHASDMSPVMQMPVMHLLSQRSGKVEGGAVPAGTDTANSNATNNSRATQNGGQTKRTTPEANLVVYGSNGRRYYCHLSGR